MTGADYQMIWHQDALAIAAPQWKSVAGVKKSCDVVVRF
jgi:hypothetical protein